MTKAGQHDESPIHDEEGNNDMASEVPQHRAGMVDGPAGEIPAKYKLDSAIQIDVVISKKRYPKMLYAAKNRKNPKTGLVEYQLRETKEDTGVYYMNGRWFPEKDVHILK